MKNQKRSIVFFACILFISLLQAQESTVPVREPDLSKPALFKNFPDRIPFTTIQLTSLLQAKRGQEIHFALAPGFLMKGSIASEMRNENGSQHSMMMKLEDIDGGFIHLSTVVLQDGTEKISGMIMSFKSGDAFELIKEGNNYFFIKKGLYDLISE